LLWDCPSLRSQVSNEDHRAGKHDIVSSLCRDWDYIHKAAYLDLGRFWDYVVILVKVEIDNESIFLP
jgi:hypothetical protein